MTKPSRPRAQKGFSLIELLIVVAIILVIAAIAIPSLLRSKISANEASAVGSLHAINTACQDYSTTYGIGFPATLADLGPSTNASSTAADLLDSVLSSGTKAGYTFTYTAGSPDGSGTIDTYTITAVPEEIGSTGQRGFFTDQSLVIRVNASGLASVTDPPIS